MKDKLSLPRALIDSSRVSSVQIVERRHATFQTGAVHDACVYAGERLYEDWLVNAFSG